MLDAGAPVELRVVPREGHRLNRSELVSAKDARATVRDDCVRQVVALLSGGTLLRDRGTEAGAEQRERPLHPGDVAVIVRTNPEAVAIQDRLRAAGVPAVVSGRTSVFSTPAAEEWQWLLEALEQPHRTARVRRLAVGRLVGLDAAALVEGTRLDALALQLRTWGRVLADRGVAALFEAVSVGLGLQERLLSQPDGERLLTDLRHVAEVLHEAALDADLGLTALASWLHRRRTELADATERSRRLETDADAVQVLTSHMSKGLEFPVVLAPSLWNHWSPTPTYPRFHDERGVRTRDVGGPGSPGYDDHASAQQQEEADEDLRLAYVTLTRAKAKVVTWWAPTANTTSSPLHRLLLHDDPHLGGAPQGPRALGRGGARRAFRARAARSGGTLAVERVAVGRHACRSAGGTPRRRRPGACELARFDRGLDLTWRRTSYSALTHAAHEATYGAGGPGAVVRPAAAGAVDPPPVTAVAAFGSEPETAQKDDEADATEVDVAAGPAPGDPDAPLHEVPSLWHDLAGGTGFGTLVHRVLEHYDPAVHGPGGTSSLAELVGGLTPRPGRRPVRADRGAGHGAGHPARPPGRRPVLRRGRAGATCCRSSTSSSRWPGATPPRPRPAALGGLVDVWRTHVPDGAAVRLPRRARPAGGGPAARLPQRVGRRRGPGRPARGPSGTWSSTTRPTAWRPASSR